MRKQKSHAFASLLFMLVFLLACSKPESTNDVVSYDHLRGRFLCQVDYNWNYTNEGSTKDYDEVISISVLGDSLCVLDRKFAISNANQASFILEDIDGVVGKNFSLTYSSDFNTISIEEIYPSEFSGPSSATYYSGQKTDLFESDAPHAYLEDLQGTYAITAEIHNTTSCIDTTFTTEFYVTMEAGNVILSDFYSQDIGTFHSYLQRTSYSVYPAADSERSIYWANDSLYLSLITISGEEAWGVEDTVAYLFSGVKM